MIFVLFAAAAVTWSLLAIRWSISLHPGRRRTSLLLMTWLDEYDHEPRTKLSFDQVQNHNSVVIAQAEHQWFHHPDYRPRVIERDFPALSLGCYGKRGYDGVSSRRRHATQQLLNDMIEGPEPRELALRQINWSGAAHAA